MEDFHRERHDLINKLIVLKNEIEHGEKENVIREIDKIIENNHTENYISDSGNQVIDALLNTKYSIAKENGIQFLLKIFIPEELPVNQCDLGVVSRTGHPYCPESLLEAEALGLYAGSVVQRVGEHFGRVTQVTHRLYGEAVESRGDYVEPFGTRPVQGLAQGQQGEREVVAALG